MTYRLCMLLFLAARLLNVAAASEMQRLTRRAVPVHPSAQESVGFLASFDELDRQNDVVNHDTGVVIAAESPSLALESARDGGQQNLDVGASAVVGYGLRLPSRQGGLCNDGDQKAFPVDVVIPCSSPDDAKLLNVETMEARDRDNNELTYTLRAIAKNAPWVRRIFLLVNNRPDMSSKIAEPNKTEVVNRCELLPGELCTRNGFVASSVVHKIPGLSEHFIYSDDDNLLCQPACVSDFFDVNKGKPRVFGTAQFHDLYEFPGNTGLSNDEIPRRTNSISHTWNPMTKSALDHLETRFSKWFSFMRSHRLGRYSSKLNQSGTTASDEANSCEEDLQSRVWWWWLINTDGEYMDDRRFRDTHHSRIGRRRMGYNLASYDTYTWNQFKADPPFLQNINDDMGHTDYEVKHAVMIATLEAMFPAHPSMAEEADAKAGANCQWPWPVCFAMGW